MDPSLLSGVLSGFSVADLDALPVGAKFCHDNFVPYTKHEDGWTGLVGSIRYYTAAELKTTIGQDRRRLVLPRASRDLAPQTFTIRCIVADLDPTPKPPAGPDDDCDGDPNL